MRKRKRSLKFLFVSILSLFALGSVLYYLSPYSSLAFPQQYIKVFSLGSFLQIPTVIVFFLLLALFLFSLGSYLFKSKIHGALIAMFVIIYLLFRLNNLTHPFFLVLLLALFFTLEMVTSNKNGSR